MAVLDINIGLVSVTTGGTVDAITATFSPAYTSLTDKMLVWVVATGANTSTTPSFAPDGLAARTIVKQGGQALAAGDIPGALAVINLEYNLANTRWELLNPASSSSSNASETVKGVVEEATQAEINAGTDTGGTGARLFIVPSKLMASALTIDGIWHFVSAKLRLFNAAKTTFIEFTTSPSANRSQIFPNKNGTFQMDADKDISNGIVGLTLLKINFKNVANTFTSFFTNTNTAARTYTFQDSDDTIVGRATTDTLTNKRITPRVLSAASYVTNTGTSLDCDTLDEFIVTAQAGALLFNNPSGTPTEGQALIIRIKDDGTARALTYDTQYRAIGVSLPTTTVISKTMYLGLIFNSTDTKWDCIGVSREV